MLGGIMGDQSAVCANRITGAKRPTQPADDEHGKRKMENKPQTILTVVTDI